jgi:hypothetical protein
VGGVDLALCAAAGAHAEVGLHHLGFELSGKDALDASIERARASFGPDVVEALEQVGRDAAVLRDPDGIACKFFIPEPAAAGPRAVESPFLL